MKRVEVSRFVRELVAPRADGYVYGGGNLVRPPVDWFLRLIGFERTSDPNALRLWAIAQPLFFPTDTEMLSFGRELGTVDVERRTDELADRIARIIHSDATGFLQSMQSPAEFLQAFGNLNHAAVAFAAVVAGSASAGESVRAYRDRLVRRAVEGDLSVFRSIGMADSVEAAVHTSDAAAIRLFLEWRRYTTTMLHVPRSLIMPDAELAA